MDNILLVEDNKDMRLILSNLLRDEGYDTIGAGNGLEAVKRVKKGAVDLVILDIKLPGMNGMAVLEEIKQYDEQLLVIMLTAYGEIKGAVQAMKLGAFDYITKPFDNDELLITIKRAFQTRYLTREVASLRKKLGEKIPGRIVGESPELKNVLEQVRLVAPTNMTVILQGESGTGKELVARLIHRESPRRNKSFVALDCGTIPETLIESELFGHEKGAFTGAIETKQGIFEQADGGSLFLDEITNLTQAAQKKFLRVLEEKKLQHVGGHKKLDIDARIIVATNIDLSLAVNKGMFRDDLFHRMNEFRIDLPPLRERKGDIPLLARFFLKEVNREFTKTIEGISPGAEKILVGYDWPGNVRELKNAIRRAGLICESSEILPEHLSLSPGDSFKAGMEKELKKEGSFEKIVENLEVELIKRTLKEAGGNKSRAAKLLNMNRKTFYRKLKKLGIPLDF